MIIDVSEETKRLLRIRDFMKTPEYELFIEKCSLKSKEISEAILKEMRTRTSCALTYSALDVFLAQRGDTDELMTLQSIADDIRMGLFMYPRDYELSEESSNYDFPSMTKATFLRKRLENLERLAKFCQSAINREEEGDKLKSIY